MVLLLILMVVAVVAVVGVVLLLGSGRSEAEGGSLPQAGGPDRQSPEQLVHAGQKIQAIKRYQELHGGGLKEAKDAVEAMEQPRPRMR